MSPGVVAATVQRQTKSAKYEVLILIDLERNEQLCKDPRQSSPVECRCLPFMFSKCSLKVLRETANLLESVPSSPRPWLSSFVKASQTPTSNMHRFQKRFARSMVLVFRLSSLRLFTTSEFSPFFSFLSRTFVFISSRLIQILSGMRTNKIYIFRDGW